ncbi:MAG: hypothetical protein ABI665_00145 [Vicinamibacterales bacterium]
MAVFVGPIISWSIAKRQIRAAAQLATTQIHSSLEASNKQIIAPMRQSWINNLRDLLAELVSSSLHYYTAGFEDRTDKEYQRVVFLESKVQLMLNPNEEDHKNLEQLIRRMVGAIQYRKGEPDPFPDLHTEVLTLSRAILKREWDRVKEPIPVLTLDQDASLVRRNPR